MDPLAGRGALESVNTCYLLGAGASANYDPHLPIEERPPLGAGVMECTKARELLSIPRYAELREFWEEFKEAGPPPHDVESAFEEGAKEYGRLIAEHQAAGYPRMGPKSRDRALHNAIGKFPFFLFEVFQHYSTTHSKRPNLYSAIFNRCMKDPGVVLSLNYDMLLEQTIEAGGGTWNHIPWMQKTPGLWIAKLHGSINWMNLMSGPFLWDDEPTYSDHLFDMIAQFTHTSRIKVREVRRITIPELLKTGLPQIVRNGMDYDQPVILPPLGGHKDYEQIDVYPAVWKASASLLRDADRLVTLGTSLNPLDSKLRGLLAESLKPGTELCIVGPPSRPRAGLLQSLPWADRQGIREFDDFEEYSAAVR